MIVPQDYEYHILFDICVHNSMYICHTNQCCRLMFVFFSGQWLRIQMFFRRWSACNNKWNVETSRWLPPPSTRARDFFWSLFIRFPVIPFLRYFPEFVPIGRFHRNCCRCLIAFQRKADGERKIERSEYFDSFDDWEPNSTERTAGRGEPYRRRTFIIIHIEFCASVHRRRRKWGTGAGS